MIHCYGQRQAHVETNGSRHWSLSTAGLIFRYLSTARLAPSLCFDSEKQYYACWFIILRICVHGSAERITRTPIMALAVEISQ